MKPQEMKLIDILQDYVGKHYYIKENTGHLHLIDDCMPVEDFIKNESGQVLNRRDFLMFQTEVAPWDVYIQSNPWLAYRIYSEEKFKRLVELNKQEGPKNGI